MDFFAPDMEHIAQLCRMHKVRSFHAFGSAVKGGLRPESDVDLLVDLLVDLRWDDPFECTDHYWASEDAYTKTFDRPVDLISRRALRNRYFIDAVDASKVTLHEA